MKNIANFNAAERLTLKVKELSQWLQGAQNEVNTEKDKERQQALLQKL